MNRGRPPLLQNPRQITVQIEKEIFDQLADRSRRSRLPLAELVRRAIDNYLQGGESRD